jgi:hypothetical protein
MAPIWILRSAKLRSGLALICGLVFLHAQILVETHAHDLQPEPSCIVCSVAGDDVLSVPVIGTAADRNAPIVRPIPTVTALFSRPTLLPHARSPPGS